MDEKLKARAAELTEYWLDRDGRLARKWGDLKDEHRQAAHCRIQEDLESYDEAKGSLSAFVRARVGFAIQDQARADGSGMIGTRRGKSMPVNAECLAETGQRKGAEFDNLHSLKPDDKTDLVKHRDSILDYEADEAPGALCDPDSPLAPIFDAQPATLSVTDKHNLEGNEDYRQIPAARRAYHREERQRDRGIDRRWLVKLIKSFKTRYPHCAADSGSDFLEIVLNELRRRHPDKNESQLMHLARSAVKQPSKRGRIVATRAVTQAAVCEAATRPTTFRQLQLRIGRTAWVLTNALYERLWPNITSNAQKMTTQRQLLRLHKQGFDLRFLLRHITRVFDMRDRLMADSESEK